ncbi:MAG: hypothetical protein J6O04_07010 [Selenomonadaceae bacterium]|nr:hypothetical protein [Selenomonadaceae bacterium]
MAGCRGGAPAGVLEKHRRFSVANASHAKTSQERKPQAKCDWMTLTAGRSPNKYNKKGGRYESCQQFDDD